jgi:hypothetical protein
LSKAGIVSLSEERRFRVLDLKYQRKTGGTLALRAWKAERKWRRRLKRIAQQAERGP